MSSKPLIYLDAVGRDVFVDRKRVTVEGRRDYLYGVYTRLAPYVVTKVGGIPLMPLRRDAICLPRAHAKHLGWQLKSN